MRRVVKTQVALSGLALILAISTGCSAYEAVTGNDIQREVEVHVDRLPASLEEFEAMVVHHADTPEKAIAAWLSAQLVLENDLELGVAMLGLIGSDEVTQIDGEGQRELRNINKQRVRERFGANAAIARSYVSGTTPADGYELPAPNGPFTFTIRYLNREIDADGGTAKMFVVSSGADNERPIQLRRVAIDDTLDASIGNTDSPMVDSENGDEPGTNMVWRVYEFSAMTLGVKAK